MPVQPTYPGVYIEEIPSGVHTITGVATSITAFIGRAARGPVNKAITIESFADFERIFGGLWLESTLGYAVKDFYLNGGSQAVIVRLYSPYFATLANMQAARTAAQGVSTSASTAAAVANATGNDVAVAARKNVTDNNYPPGGPEQKAADLVATRAEQEAKNGSDAATVKNAAAEAVDKAAPVTKTQFSIGGLPFVAAYEGSWGENLRAAIDFNVSADVATDMGLQKTDLFNLAVIDSGNGLTELYRNLTLKESPRRVDKVLEDVSKLVRWAGAVPPTEVLPPPAAKPLTDDVTTAEKALSDARKASSYNKAKLAITAGASQQSAIADATKALADANTKLDAANKANPQVPADIKSAQQAVADAQKALDAAQPGAVAQKNLADAKTKLTAAKGANPQVPADIKNAQQAVDVAQASVEALSAVGAIDTAQTTLSTNKVALVTSDGNALVENDFVGDVNQVAKLGLYALEQVDLFNLLCIPPYKPGNDESGDIDVDLVSEAAAYCETRRAMLLIDPPSDWIDKDAAVNKFTDATIDNVGTRSKNAAIFFPRLKQPNRLRNNQVETFVPCGLMAGIFARTDSQRGVWKAPAGLEASLVGVPQLSVNLTDLENGLLNPLGINCLRSFPIYGRVAWGSRTLRGADQFADEYKYIPVRRTALFIEESLYRGTQWVVFEPNDEPLWAQIRLNVGAFMHNLFRQGAFQGKTPRDAYLVKCDSETTTQNDIDLGIVNILVAFAPLKPAEFVIIQIKQLAGQIEV
jgi:phage tail sheath protein FI